MMGHRADAYFLDAPGQPLARRVLEIPDPGPTEALVEVLACGLCHTDLAYAEGSAPTRRPPPLVLGHEIVGTVVAAGASAAIRPGTPVLVPAVLPCGGCMFCRAGRGNACPEQKMPGNDVHGGFATHVLLPAFSLVPLSSLSGVDLFTLAVVADAVSTAYQAVRRAALRPGDLAVVVGAGGVGAFVVQVARALGARVIACDVRTDRLALAGELGAEERVTVLGADPGPVRRRVRDVAGSWGIPSLRQAIFECSGTPEGQLLAFALLGRAATLVQVGYTARPVEVRLSNLMAFDATLHGTWGCPPEAYPEVLALVEKGQVRLDPLVDRAPMSQLNDLLRAMAENRLARRMILDPRA
jgi:6-hydroxycyclohex-1-ene-1-carbonyl-CoA dehydrogenase